MVIITNILPHGFGTLLRQMLVDFIGTRTVRMSLNSNIRLAKGADIRLDSTEFFIIFRHDGIFTNGELNLLQTNDQLISLLRHFCLLRLEVVLDLAEFFIKLLFGRQTFLGGLLLFGLPLQSRNALF